METQLLMKLSNPKFTGPKEWSYSYLMQPPADHQSFCQPQQQPVLLSVAIMHFSDLRIHTLLMRSLSAVAFQ